MGMLGQGARAVVGLKGMSDDAKALNLSPNDLFEAGRLITSIIIGFLVGLAAALITLKGGDVNHITIPGWTTLLAWAASGYAGTDFLEGFIAQYLPQGAPGSTAQKLAAGASVKPQVAPAPQQPAAAFTYSEAEKIVMDVLQAGPQVNDKTSLSDIGYANIENLYILAGQINAVIIKSGYLLDNSGISKWSTVGDVVKNVQNAPKKPGGRP
jgi:hypothetical protein